jgi:polyisoprenoid-binding protein YceI
MQRIFLLIFIMIVGPVFASDTYTFDTAHSYILYRISHLGFSNQTGKWYFSGSLTLDEAHPEKSKVNVSLDINSLDSGLQELNQHLLGPLFFDVAKYPKATFVSDKVILKGDKNAEVIGKLTLHGITKPISIQISFNKQGVNLISNKKTLGFSGVAELQRSDFGINGLLPTVGDKVNLVIEAEAYQ